MQGKETEDTNIGKERLSLFTDDMVAYEQNLKSINK